MRLPTTSSQAVLATALLLAALPATAAGSDLTPVVEIPAAPAEACALLDDPVERGKMDGLLMNLLWACGRQDELGQVESLPGFVAGTEGVNGAPDVQFNDSTGESGTSTTQSETSIAESLTTGTLCAGWNDSWEFFGGGGGFTGFGRSTDGGLTWDDRGPVGSSSAGDPSVIWSERDQVFYFATLNFSLGLDFWVSGDDCMSFSFRSSPASGSDDKELLTIDNNPASPFFGRIYLAWTDFGSGSRIYVTTSDDGGFTWSAQLAVSGVGVDAQGAWPTVAPNGDVFIGWVEWIPFFPTGDVTARMVRSTDGGASFANITPPMDGEVNPRDDFWTGQCFRPALNGGIRYLPSPQLVVSPNGDLHTVNSYDPDGFNVGDVVNVYYRKSTDSGATWGPEIQLNDVSTNDQYFPTISVGDDGTLMATWYDRRLDGANFLQDTFKSVSTDGGDTWSANERISDESAPIQLDPNLATCYHGDYDTTIISTAGDEVAQWADDRNICCGGRNDPDVWGDTVPGNGGGGIPCADVDRFQARCIDPGPGPRVQYRVIMTDASHDGESVTFAVDGTPDVRTINGTQARGVMLGVSGQTFTVSLDDPAGCFPDRVVTCP